MKYRDSFLVCFNDDGEKEIYHSGILVGKVNKDGLFIPHDPSLGTNSDPTRLEDILMGIGGPEGIVDSVLNYLNEKAFERNKKLKKTLDETKPV